jgi:murein DD-endopeptidase MepM/ murein hydrolase activator NlpD
LSFVDPFEELGLGSSRGDNSHGNESSHGDTPHGDSHPRRRDLREKSTRRSRKASRKRSGARRSAPPARPAQLATPSPNVGAAPGPVRRGKKLAPRKPLGKRVAAKLFSVLALALAAAFGVATAGSPLLAAGVTTGAKTTASSTATIDGQHLSAASAQAAPIARDSFQALSSAELHGVIAGVGVAGYTVNNSGPIRWPINSAVPLGDMFGPRKAPCAGCSTFHKGTDFETGAGAPVYAVAAGVVTVSEFSGALGQHVAISHNVNGKIFTSIYGHMKANSSTLKVGDTVAEGAVVGLTGSTGESTGPHLDFEIDIDAVPVDSFIWLKANTAH